VTSSFHLGTIRGIRIGINWSLLVIFALIAWTLADGIFPRENPGLSQSTYVGMAVIAATLFFASILAHELGHAFVAQHEGMEIQGITLWLFGGVARFRGEFPSAGAEGRIAVAGPVVTAVIGGACVGIAQLDLPDPVDGVAAWLCYINLLLLAFNLLPALPLDGGRILRSILWKVRGNFAWATVISAWTGQGIGVLVAAAGIALIVIFGAFSGAWLAFMGWFLYTAAGDERRTAGRLELFGDRNVAELMVSDPITVPGGATVGELADAMTPAFRHSTYPVVDGERPVGLLPFARIVEAPREQWEGKLIREFALPLTSIPTFRPDQPAIEAVTQLAQSRLGRGLVIDGERLVGLLAREDLLRVLHAAARR
jgi:Zn-dependent protease/CBS domain-containing protein